MQQSHTAPPAISGITGGAACLALAAVCGAQSVEVIYTEIPGHPTASVPGARDAAGNPVPADFTALEDIAVSHDGSQWMLKGRSNLGTALDTLLILGSGLAGNMFAQDGQPFQGGQPGELYDFFDTPVPASWDESGNIGFSARAKGGVSAVKEKIVKVVGGVHTVVYTESSPTTGLVDVPANPTGDELIGNSVGSVQLRNDGQIFFGNTPIQQCHSSRYPALFLNNAGFMQSGVSTIGFETWDSFDYDGCGMTPDGQHWFAVGDTENPVTTLDNIFAVDNVKIVQENTEIGNTGVIAAAIFFVRMVSTGDWFARGDDTADNDWALRNNVLVAKTGDPITSGSSELWGAVFNAFNGNRKGDWVLAGNTNNADVNLDNVVVLNGETVIAREGDPVDLNDNGQPDDDAFINSFQANDLFLTDDGVVFVLTTLRNQAGTALGDAFLRLQLAATVPCPADIAPTAGDGQVNVDDLLAVIGSWGPCKNCPADINDSGAVDVDDLLAVIGGWGPCQ